MTTRTTQQLFNLEGRTALITGGSRGLGLQMAFALGEAMGLGGAPAMGRLSVGAGATTNTLPRSSAER